MAISTPDVAVISFQLPPALPCANLADSFNVGISTESSKQDTPTHLLFDSFNVGISTESSFAPLFDSVNVGISTDHSVNANHALVIYRI